MKVYIPYTQLNPATAYVVQALPSYELVKVDDSPTAYVEYFQSRWDIGEDFITMEHDIVPWPGAIDQIGECKAPWCVFAYYPEQKAIEMSFLGLVKISSVLIRAIPDVWRDMGTTGNLDRLWMLCDQQLFFYATRHGIWPHQHFPPVVNVKPTNEIQRSR